MAISSIAQDLEERFTAIEQANLRLEIRCGILEEEADALRRELGVGLVPAGFLGLSGLEAALLAMLLQGDEVRRSAAYSALYASRDKKARGSVVGAMISRMREKLKPHGIEIQNIYAHGYRLPGGSKAIIRSLLEQREHGEAE